MKKLAVDILMFVAIILEFCSLPLLAHEIVGIGLFFLIMYHLKLNKRYFKAIGKGKYDAKRIIGLIINIGLTVSLLITIISGIFASQKSLKEIKIGNFKPSKIHKTFSLISLILLAAHIISNRKKLLREIKKIKA